MLHRSVLLALLLLSTSPIAFSDTQYAVFNNAENEAGGQKFDQVMGLNEAQSILMSATQFIQNAFYVGEPSVPQKQVNKITFYVDDQPQGNAVAFTTGDGVDQSEIHLSESYVASYSGSDVATEIEGVIYHEMTHVWQWNGQGQADGGLIEGMADYIRLTAGLAPSHWVQPGQGDQWDQGYDVTAYFLQYCESLMPGFVRSLNAKMATGWDVSYFQDLLGQTVDQLWESYKQKYGM